MKILVKFEEKFAPIKISLVQGLNSFLAPFLSYKLDNTATFRLALVVFKNVNPDNITRLSHVVF